MSSTHRFKARPARSGMIWSMSLAVALLSALTGFAGLYVYDQEPLVGALTVLLAAFQFACAVGLFAGAGWSRNGARTVCVLHLLGGLFVMLNAPSIYALAWLAVNFVVLVALSGEKVRDWCVA